MRQPRFVRSALASLLCVMGLAAVASATPATADPPVANRVVLWGYGEDDYPPPAGLTDVAAVDGGEVSYIALTHSGEAVYWEGGGGVLTMATDATAVSSGAAHVLVLRSNGTVIGLGGTGAGQEIPPAGLSGVTAISGGREFSLAVTGGSVVAWGDNEFGQSTVPAGLTGITKVAAGGFHSLALRSNGTVTGWGANYYGQTSVPGGLTGVVAIAAGIDHSLALKSDGTVRGWGANHSGQRTVPAGLTGVVAIAAGDYYSMALKSDGTIVAWGDNLYGSTSVPNIGGVTAIGAGAYTPLAVAPLPSVVTGVSPSSGSPAGGNPVVISGTNFAGATGVTFGGRPATSFSIDSDTQITAIAPADKVGSAHVQVATVGGTSAISPADLYGRTFAPGSRVNAWGTESHEGSGENMAPPGGMTNAVAVAAGRLYSAAVRADGSLVLWGSNVNSATHIPAGLSGVIDVAADEFTGYALKRDGTVQLLGFNSDHPAFSRGVVDIAHGRYNAMGLKADGRPFDLSEAAFSGMAGEPGVDYGQFVVPSGLRDVVDVAGGFYHFVAAKSDGTVVAWGSENLDEQPSAVPAGLSDVIAVAAGYATSYALRSDGTVVAWGRNNAGQTTVPAGLSGVVAIAAGFEHALALKSDGTIVGWGRSDNAVPAGLTGAIAIGAGWDHSVAVVANNAPAVNLGADVARAEALVQDFPAASTVDRDGDAVSNVWTVTPGAGVDPGASCTNVAVGSVQRVICNDDGQYTVTLTSTESAGLSASDSLVLTVDNRAPVLGTISGPSGSVPAGTSVSLSATLSDPSPNDTLLCSVDWGDTFATMGTVAGGMCSASHTYATAGTFTATMTGNDDDGGTATKTRSVTVTSVSQTIDFPAPAGRAFGDAPFSVSATASSGLPVSFGATGPCSISGTTVTITGAGTCAITASQAGNGAYDPAPPVTQNVAIAKAVLQVTADAKSKAQGTANPPLTYAVTGFVNGEGASVLSGAPALTTTATQSSPAGSYPITITQGTLDAANYSFTFTGNTLTVFVPPLDTDGDGNPNATDNDDDNDGILDRDDGYPLVKDGLLSGAISRQVKDNPGLKPSLDPLHSLLLSLGL